MKGPLTRVFFYLKVYYFILYTDGNKFLRIFAAESIIYHTMQNKMEIGPIIKDRRTRLKLTQQDLAEFAEIGIATVKDIERGKGNPSLQTLQKILNVLGLEMSFKIKKFEYVNENMK